MRKWIISVAVIIMLSCVGDISAQTEREALKWPDPKPCKLSPEYKSWILYRFEDFIYCAPPELAIKPGWGETMYMGYSNADIYFAAGLSYSRSRPTTFKGIVNEVTSTRHQNQMLITRYSHETTPRSDFPYANWLTAYFEPENSASKMNFYITIGGRRVLNDLPEKVFRSVFYSPVKPPSVKRKVK